MNHFVLLSSFCFHHRGVSWNWMILPPQTPSVALSALAPCFFHCLVQKRSATLASPSYWWSGGYKCYLIFQREVWSWTKTGRDNNRKLGWAVTFAIGVVWLSVGAQTGSHTGQQATLIWKWEGYITLRIYILWELLNRRRLLKELGKWFFVCF